MSSAVEWRAIPGQLGYEVSSTGLVRSWKRAGSPALHDAPRLLTPYLDRKGYEVVRVSTAGIERSYKVHRLVAEVFIGPRPEGMQTRHLDGDQRNNAASNLAYGTSSENRRDRQDHGTDHNLRKTHCPKGHPYDETNTYRAHGKRYCRACGRLASRSKRARRAMRP